jgi:dTDP-4-dehydrorhamnose 3,5-epimerase
MTRPVAPTTRNSALPKAVQEHGRESENEREVMGNFTFIPTEIPDVVIVETKTYGDSRGYFMETYQEQAFVSGGIKVHFVQDNQSSSTRGVLRGLHFQKCYPQAKLVRVLSGAVFDVAVDIRRDSPTYGKWVGVELSAENRRQLFVPRGLAHGFLVLTDSAEFAYKCDEFYHPEDEGGLAWDDPQIGVRWPLGQALGKEKLPILSDKDKANLPLSALCIHLRNAEQTRAPYVGKGVFHAGQRPPTQHNR